MQGTLREIDVYTIIHLIELGQRTGELLIESITGKVWFLFFNRGELIYATDTNSNLIRLRDYLHGLGLDHAIDRLANSKLGINVLEYGQIWSLLESNILNPGQAKSIVESTMREVLFEILSLYQGTFVFEISPALTPRLTHLKVSQISAEFSRQLQAWRQFYPFIQSVEQCPVLLSNDALPQVSTWIDGKTTIRQLSRYSGLDICKVGQLVYEAIATGEVTVPPLMLNVLPQAKVVSPKILYVDDSITICRAVEYILHNHGYQVTAVSSPIKALNVIFQYKPNLILCDITMPEIDGYELCGMLRRSSAFATIPIIMLTGKDCFIDRVKARMVGATEYLTKPFGEKELLTTIEKHSKASRQA